MAPSAGERLNMLEAGQERLQEGLDELRQEQAAHRAATSEKFATLEQSITAQNAVTQANQERLEKDLAAIISLLTPRRQDTQLPDASSTPATTSSLQKPKDPASVELPASPSPANSPVVATGGVPPPLGDLPTPDGLLFTSLSETRDEAKGETEGAYRARLAKEAKAFLAGRIPPGIPTPRRDEAGVGFGIPGACRLRKRGHVARRATPPS
jgi:hypothetical protein